MIQILQSLACSEFSLSRLRRAVCSSNLTLSVETNSLSINSCRIYGSVLWHVDYDDGAEVLLTFSGKAPSSLSEDRSITTF